MSLKTEWDKLLELTPEEQTEHEASMLAFQFLGRIDETMIQQNMSKKKLAEKVGTSPSFITQLFRGDRKPNWNILAKMQKELGIEFVVTTPPEIEEVISSEIKEYHRKWNKKRAYEKNKGLEENYDSILFVDKDYALAG